jgi:hypothetical protein
MHAITRTFPPHSGQRSMSIANTRLRRCAHWTGSPGAAAHRDVRERPAHGRHFHPAARPARHDLVAVPGVGREYTRDGFAPLLFALRAKRAVTPACAMKAGEVQSRAWYEGGEPGYEVQWFQYHVG